MYALHHKQDDTKPSMWEIMEQDRQLTLCTQNQNQSDSNYIKVFKNLVGAINEAGKRAGATPRLFDLVCHKQGLEYTSIPQEIESDGKNHTEP